MATPGPSPTSGLPPGPGVGSTTTTSSFPPPLDVGPSPVPPPPVIPDIPRPTVSLDTKFPRMLKATYMTKGEKLLWETRPTRWYFLPVPTIVLALIVVVDAILLKAATNSAALSFLPTLPGSLAPANPSATLVSVYEITAVVLLLLGVLYFGIRWLHYASTVYVVTNTRVIRQKGILGRDYDEVQLLQVRGVDVVQKLWQRLLGYGVIRISAEFGGTRQAMGNEEWPGVPRPISFERTIEEAQQRLRGILPPSK